jgi:hypothetical protein
LLAESVDAALHALDDLCGNFHRHLVVKI